MKMIKEFILNTVLLFEAIFIVAAGLFIFIFGGVIFSVIAGVVLIFIIVVIVAQGLKELKNDNGPP